MTLTELGKRCGTWTVIGGAVSAVLTGAYALGDKYGFRPALKAEVLEVAENVDIIAGSVGWLEFYNYERTMERRRLTSRECARYRSLARQLGVEPKPC